MIQHPKDEHLLLGDEPKDASQGEPIVAAEARSEGTERSTLADRLNALPEPTMQLAVLAEYLTSHDKDTLVKVLTELEDTLTNGSSSHADTVLLKTFGRLLAYPESFSLAYKERLFRVVQSQGFPYLSRLCIEADAARQSPSPKPTATSTPKTRDTLTLGERRAVARKPDRKTLDRLLNDPEPMVIKELLKNPKLTQSDVIRITSRRPVRPEVLLEIFKSRWANQYEVRLALVKNPYLPTGTALRLLVLLRSLDLHDIAQDNSLHIIVRETARALRETPKAARQK